MSIRIVESPDGYYERCRWLVSKTLAVNGNIIDIGCSDAFMFRDIARDRTTFIDNNPEAEKACVGLNFHLVDAHNLPFADNSFDVAVLGETLEHVRDPVKILQEALRVCRKKLLITTPNEYEWTAEARPFQFAPHVRFYTEEMLRQHLHEAGIEKFDLFKIRGGAWCFFAVEVDKL